jgi:hypothetical protein
MASLISAAFKSDEKVDETNLGGEAASIAGIYGAMGFGVFDFFLAFKLFFTFFLSGDIFPNHPSDTLLFVLFFLCE